MNITDPAHAAKTVFDAAAVSAIAASWTNWMSPVSTVVAFIYLLIRLGETKTAQAIMRRIRSYFQ